jgi:4-hydroxy-tetrahydrodipicolinate synthase
MASARDARNWAASALRGIGDSLYTPFAGPDGDDIDWNAYRALVRYCVGDLRHPLLWLTSGLAEFWSLTMDERKKLLEVAIEEARAINPATVIQACTASVNAKECLELTLHAQEVGADIVYIQTPMMEVHGGEGVLRFFKYVADRTDIALGLFNSGSSGYVLTPDDVVALYDAIPAICAMKDGTFQPARTVQVAARTPGMQLWECDTLALTAGWAAKGLICKAQLGTSAYLFDFPGNPRGTIFNNLLWEGRIDEALAFVAATPEVDTALKVSSKWLTSYPGRPGYFTHWGETIKLAASLIGLPVGSYPYSRPPQGRLPEHAKNEIRAAFERGGLIGLAKKDSAQPAQPSLAVAS